jgi:hypothetical protein
MTVSSDCRHRFEPLFDIHPVTGASIEVFLCGRARHVRQGRHRLVLVATPARVLTGWSSGRAVRYELRRVPTRDEIADASHLLMHERFANRTSLSMCHACDMEQPTHDDTWLESLVFTSIF